VLLDKYRRTGLVALGLFGIVGVASASGVSSIVKPDLKALTPAQAQERLGLKANRFIENAGQWDARARFLARARGADVWITREGVTYDFYRPEIRDGQHGASGQVVQMSFVNGAGGKAVGVQSVRMTTSFIDSMAGRKHEAAGYSEVLSRGIYPGVDKRNYFDKGQARYDLIVAPGADPSQIRLAFRGADSVRVDKGDIVLDTQIGEQRQSDLFVYQMVNGQRKQVSASFKLVGKNTIGFELGAYDRSKELVIDPVTVIYGSYYGGDGGNDEVRGVTTDTSGGVYMTGYTRTNRFPAIYGPYGFNTFGGRDAFIAKLQGDAYSHDYAAIFGGSGDDQGSFIDVDPFGDVWIAGTTNSRNFVGGNTVFLRTGANSVPTGGTFTLGYPGLGNTAPLAHNASAAQVEEALRTLFSSNDVRVLSSTGSALADAGDWTTMGSYRIIYPGGFPANITVSNSLTGGQYSISAPSNVSTFIMRWAQNAAELLSPFPNAVQFFGGEADTTLANFQIVPNDNPMPGEQVLLTLAGRHPGGSVTTKVQDLGGAPLAGSTAGYVMRYAFDRDQNRFSRVPAVSGFVASNVASHNGGAINVDLSGLVVDRFGSIYVGGTVSYNQNVDTSLTSVFTTTPGVFSGGRLLRRSDMFVRKYAANGSMIYSALIGGNRDDSAGGYGVEFINFGPVPTPFNTGTTIAIDPSLNLYITGISRSFNFPRTRGVFGEVFEDRALVTVTKINADASQMVYSTHLRSNFGVLPGGIGVDQRGQAYVTGHVLPRSATFPDSGGNPLAAQDPNEPTSELLSSIFLTADALDPDYTTPGTPQVPTIEAFITVLNSTATDVIYSSYIGGVLDETVFAPYVDRFGDVWVYGGIDTVRGYQRPRPTNPPVTRTANGSLPAALITPLAFKRFPDTDTAPGTTVSRNIWFGWWDPGASNYMPISWAPAEGQPAPFAVPTASASFQRDGFVIKMRVGLAAVSNILLNPGTAPGGLGQEIQGAVVLSEPAPLGGAEITLTLNNTEAASFGPGDQTIGTRTVLVPAGETTAPFIIYTRGVQGTTNVQVRASYQGSFRIAQFVVIPWLQQLSITPTSVVGGTDSTGRVTLAAPAPAGGATISLGTDREDLIEFFVGNQRVESITVPAGQAAANFTIRTRGVADIAFPQVRATLLGVGISQTLTLTQASLQSITFNPARVAGGTATTGTIRLDGQAGSSFTVNLSIDAGTPGYSVPASVTFEAGETSKTFTLQTAFESTNTSRRVTAFRPAQGAYPAQTVDGTIFVDAVFLQGFTLSTGTINGGQTATGTVSINSPAPSGGVVVNLASSNIAVATVPATVTVPAGQTQATFQVTGQTVATDSSATITASRGPASISRTINVRGVTFSMNIAPGSVVGGAANAAGTVTLSNPAPAGGVTIALSSSRPVIASVPATVTVPFGQTSAPFTITTSPTASTQMATISATLGTNTVTSQVEVRAVGVLSVSFSPSTVRGRSTTTLTVRLEAGAPFDNTLVTLRASNPDVFVNFPSSIRFNQGETVKTVTLTTQRVSRSLSSTVTATHGGRSGSAIITVVR
jgi:hypothetical protein